MKGCCEEAESLKLYASQLVLVLDGNVMLLGAFDAARTITKLICRDACTLVLAVEAREDPNTQDTAGRLVAATVHLLQHTMTTSPTPSGSSDNSGRNMVQNFNSATSAVCS